MSASLQPGAGDESEAQASQRLGQTEGTTQDESVKDTGWGVGGRPWRAGSLQLGMLCHAGLPAHFVGIDIFCSLDASFFLRVSEWLL